MKTMRILGCLMAVAIPFLAGCEGDGYVAADYVVYDGVGDHAAISYHPIRYEYFVSVGVTDPWGFPLSHAGVELIVADIPEYSVYSTTDWNGMAGFWIEAPPGTLLSVFVDGYPYGGDYFTVFTDAYASDLYIDVTL